MAKSILRCFLFSTCYGHINSSQISSDDLDDLYNSYSEDLNQISKSFYHGSISHSWSVRVMEIIKKMQVELLILIKKSYLPIPTGIHEDGNWFNQYMKDSITTLDFCNSLKLAISRVNEYLVMVDIMLNEFNRNDSLEIMVFKSQKYSNISTMKETIGEDERINSFMVAAIVLLHSAIVSPVSIKLGGTDQYSHLKPFIEMVSMLVGEFNGRDCTVMNGSGSELIEQKIVGRVMVDIEAQMMDGIEDKDKFLSSLELLRTSSVDLKEGIEKLGVVVDDVFHVLIRGRNEMLGVLRDKL